MAKDKSKITSCRELNQFPDILTPMMVGEVLGICYSKALELIKSGKIPAMKIGNSYKVHRKALEKWLDENGSKEFLNII